MIERVGIWWDRSPEQTRESLRLLSSPCLTDVALMCGSASDDRLIGDGWTPHGIASFAQDLRSREIALTLTVWPRPTVDCMRQIPDVYALAQDLGARVELEAEGNWSGERVRGFATLEEAGIELRGIARSSAWGMDVDTDATIHTGRINPSITEWSDYVAVQCYSKHSPDDPDRGWGAKYGPGWMQVRGFDKLAQIRGHEWTMHRDLWVTGARDPFNVPQLIRDSGLVYVMADAMGGTCGLPLWSQTYPDRSPHDAMRVAWETAEALGYTQVRYWSAKWLDRNGYARDWFASRPARCV